MHWNALRTFESSQIMRMFITVTSRLFLSSKIRQRQIMTRVWRTIFKISPMRGQHLWVTDDPMVVETWLKKEPHKFKPQWNGIICIPTSDPIPGPISDYGFTLASVESISEMLPILNIFS